MTSKHIQKHALFVRPKVAARPLGPLVADARESCERTKTSEGRDQEQRQALLRQGSLLTILEPGLMSPIVLMTRPLATAIPSRSLNLRVKRSRQKFSFR